MHDLASGALVTVDKVTSDVSRIFRIKSPVACTGFANKTLQALDYLDAPDHLSLCPRFSSD